MFARPLRPRNLPTQLIHRTRFQRPLYHHNSHRPTPPQPAFRAPPHKPKYASVEPVVFVLAFGLSFGAAYALDRYKNDTSNSHLTTEPTPARAPDHEESLALQAQLYPDVMAPQQQPGRPGNLTPDQEVKLKEMWAQTLEIFGSAPEGTHTNGTATPTTPSTPDPSSAEKPKAKGMGSKLFGRKNTADSGSGNEAGNDKHGQEKEFRQALADQKPEELREAFWSMVKHDHPDALLLRFLRARKWDVHAALVMFVSTIHWRGKEMHVDDDIMFNGEERAIKDSKAGKGGDKKEGDDFMAQLRMGKSFLHGTDKDGRPCCYVRVKLHKQGEQSEKSLERFTVYTIETTRMMLKPPVDTATIVFDMSEFSLANMDYTPVKFMIKCFEANYPESLGSVLVYKSPWVFQGIWKVIRGWLDPVVANKVHFASNVDDLQRWIPRSQISKELGGDEDYVYKYPEPVEGENSRMQDEGAKAQIKAEREELIKSWEAETLSWVTGEDKGEGRVRLAQRIAENYWKLDPYVRARSLYDRAGVIGEGGKLNFYPSSAPAAAASGGDGDLD